MQQSLDVLNEMIDITDITQHGSLQCKCGKVTVGLQEGRLRYRLECLCCDCRERIVICSNENKDNHPGIQDIIDYKKGVDSWYISNALIVSDQTKKLIQFFKLRKDSEMINMKTKCCGQYMCAIHPGYRGNVILTSPDGPKISLSPNAEIPSQMLRCWKQDFPASKYDLLPNKDTIPNINLKDKNQREKYKNIMDFLQSEINRPPPKTKNTVTFEGLFDEQWTNEWANTKKLFMVKMQKWMDDMKKSGM